MSRKKCIVYTTLLILFINGQSGLSQNRPFWANGYFKDAKNSYIEVVTATGWEAANAKQKAYQEVINRRSLTVGTEANVTTQNNQTTITSNKDLITAARIIDEYNEYQGGGLYKSYLLVQTAKNPTYELESVTITDKYPFSARVFVPGYAQIYKGSYAKGIIMIASEVVFACGIAISESLRRDYKEHIISDDSYDSKARTCSIVRDISIAGLVGVYAWSLIDGIVAPGKIHIVVGTTEAKISPAITMNAIGGSLMLNFN